MTMRAGTQQKRIKGYDLAAGRRASARNSVVAAEGALADVEEKLADREQTYPFDDRFFRSKDFTYENRQQLLAYAKKLRSKQLPALRDTVRTTEQAVNLMLMNRQVADSILQGTRADVQAQAEDLSSLRADVADGKDVSRSLADLAEKQAASETRMRGEMQEMEAKQLLVNQRFEEKLAKLAAEVELKADKADVAESMAGLREDFSKRLDTAEDDLHERLDNQDQNTQICWNGVCVPSAAWFLPPAPPLANSSPLRAARRTGSTAPRRSPRSGSRPTPAWPRSGRPPTPRSRQSWPPGCW
jgi:hypothetical protein